MSRKPLFYFLIAILSIIISLSASAQYETLSGIPADSIEYGEYKLCIDTCSQCEANCKYSAYRTAAEAKGSEEFCSNLPEAERQGCIDRAHSSKAMSLKDPAECGKIADEFEKSNCVLNVQTEKAVANENEAECNSAPEALAEMCRQSFNQRMAMQKNDESYCARITDEMLKNICSDTVAMQKGAAAPEQAPSLITDKILSIKSVLKSKSLIIYGIIILGVIAFAAAAIALVKKLSRKKPAQAPPLVVQQQKFPPLAVQQGMPQNPQGEKR